jgi:molybdate transport system regulatory protein
MAAKHSLQIRIRLLASDDIALGPGKVDLLAAIAATGSISAAAKAMGMSYRRAWLLVDTMNGCFRQPLVASATGGARGGGAQLTPLGEEVLTRYRALAATLDAAAASEGKALLALLKKSR